MQPYTGDFIPFQNEEDDLPEPIRRLRPAQAQAPTQEAPVPQEPAPAPSGLRPYQGDFVPFETQQEEEPGFWSKTGDLLFGVQDAEEFKSRWGYDPTEVGGALVDAAAGALYEGPRRMANTLSAGLDAGIEAVTGYDPGAAREKYTGSRDAGIPYEPMVSETAVELGATLAPGLGGAGAATKALSWAPRFVKYLGGTVGGSFGYATSKTPVKIAC